MEKKFRFYRNNEMEVLSLDELIETARPDLVGAPVMQSFGLEAGGKQIFAEDVLELDATKIDKKESFWHSNMGQEMERIGAEQCLVIVKTSKFQDYEFYLFLKKDGRFITENEHDEINEGEEGFEDGKNTFRSKDTGNLFIRYLCNKGAVIIGNAFENEDLVPTIE